MSMLRTIRGLPNRYGERRLVLGLLVVTVITVLVWDALGIRRLRADAIRTMETDLVSEELGEALEETEGAIENAAGDLLTIVNTSSIQRAATNDAEEPYETSLLASLPSLEPLMRATVQSKDHQRIRLFDSAGVELLDVVGEPSSASPEAETLADWWASDPASPDHDDVAQWIHLTTFHAPEGGSSSSAPDVSLGFWISVVDHSGRVVGTILLETDARALLDDLSEARADTNFFLVNSHGEVLATQSAQSSSSEDFAYAPLAAEASAASSIRAVHTSDQFVGLGYLPLEGYSLHARWLLVATSANPGAPLAPIVELVGLSLLMVIGAAALAYWLVILVERSRDGEQRYRALVERSPDGTMLLVGEDIMFVNLAAALLFGASGPSEIEGRSATPFVHPDSLHQIGAIRDAARIGSDQLFQMDIVALDGSRRTVESIGIESLFNNQPALQVVFRDVTERVKLESQLIQAQKLESIGQLAAGIAHEINTPTQFVGDNARFLRDAFEDLRPLHESHAHLLAAAVETGMVSPELVAAAQEAVERSDIEYLTEEIPSAIDQTLEGIDRVATIVRAMKDFSHPGSGSKELTDLNRALESTATVARNEWKYAADLSFDFEEDLPPVPCLIGELNQAFLNIIINAAHAIEEKTDGQTKGLISVATASIDDSVEVRITDTGGGIPEDIRARIFDPFFTTKTVGRGTGQGLAIARSVIVDKHGGTLTVDSEPGAGTTFTIRLPYREVAAEAA